MATTQTRCLSNVLLDVPMRHYFACKFPWLPADELDLRIEETLRFLFLAHECQGHIPVSREIDEIWHAWILQTQEYMALCNMLPAGSYIHHTSNDYLRYFDPSVGDDPDLVSDVRMLTLYVDHFGPFEERRAQHWLLAWYLLQRRNWTLTMLNEWLLGEKDGAASTAERIILCFRGRYVSCA